jgi:hypothetical protein
MMEGNKMAEKTSPRESAGLPDYQVLVQDDEIDLVDLWLFFWDQRKIFFASAILIAVVGVVGFKMFYQPKQVSIVRSIIVVDNKVMGQAVAPVFSSDALAKRIEYVDLPQIASLPKYELIKPYILATKATPVAATNMVEITSEIPGNDAAEVTKFQSQLVEQIYSELSNSSYSLTGDIGSSLVTLKRSVTSLQQWINAISREAELTGEPRDVSYQLFLNQLRERKNGLSKELDSLSMELNYLESALPSFEPRILVKGQVSGKTVGLKSSTAYSLIIILAFFLAISIVVGVAFVSKVQDRMAGSG